ncbi:unnamed protein product [Prunus armeniaca]
MATQSSPHTAGHISFPSNCGGGSSINRRGGWRGGWRNFSSSWSNPWNGF